MLHFQPDEPGEASEPSAASSRLRHVRQALALVEMMEGRPRRDPETIGIEALLPLAAPAVRRCVESRSLRAAGAAAAGIETLLGAESAGESPNPAALDVLGETLRRDLAGIEALFAGRA
jgi:hypothetical protein